jgi:ArsR family transcriptional regulator
MNRHQVDRLARFYAALGNETRLRLVMLLAALGPGDALCVNAVVARLGVSQPAVSQHLAVLRAAGLVVAQRRGYHVHYRLNPAALAAYRRRALALLGERFLALPADLVSSRGRASARAHHKQRIL